MTAKEIRALRANLKVTQKKFAGLIGVSPRLVQAWEAGHLIPNGAAEKMLAQAATFFSTENPKKSP